MALYTKDSIDRVKDAVDMVALVGARTELRRSGRNWSGLCPFHEERTPSFSVNAEHKLYYCFGCGESGDSIRFVQATEGLDFAETLEYLAERHNVELKRESEDPQAEERRRRRERLLKLVDRAATFYARVLWEAPEAARAREYLLGRGLSEEVLTQFRVGYSQSAWDTLTIKAQRDGFTREELASAGLGQRGREGGFYDRFRARIMFPLCDARGRVLGFGARAVRDEQQPKYVNTSENELYHKGRQLFGIDQARAPAAKAGRVIAVEGYTDVLALHQAGVKESVAIMGTALTQEQLAELGRAASTVHLALDADRAGQEAMLRASRSAKERGLDLRVVELPEGKDPADLLGSEGPEAFSRRLEKTLSVPEFQARRIIASADLGTPHGRDQALAEVRPLVARLRDNPATRDALVRFVSDRLDIDREFLMTQVSAPMARVDVEGVSPAVAPAAARPSLDAIARAERTFLTMCVGAGEVGHDYVERLGPEHLTFRPLRDVRDHLLRHWDDPLADLPENDPTIAALVKDVVMRADEEEVTAEALRLDFLKLERQRVDRALRHAAENGDLEAQRNLARERQTLIEQFSDLMGTTL